MSDQTKSYFMEKISKFMKDLNAEIVEKEAKVGVAITATEHFNEDQGVGLIGYAGVRKYQRYAVASLLKQQLSDL